jgi:hypothetical protein
MEQRGVGLTFIGAMLILAVVVGVIWLAHRLNDGPPQSKSQG